jgi:PBSX family phage terminase large subunit
MAIEYELYTQQYAFVMDESRHSAFVGGIGSGKTLAGCMKAWRKAGSNPGIWGLIAAPTYDMLRTTCIPTLFDIIPPDCIADYNKSERRVELLNGSIIWFRFASDPDKLRGPNLGFAYLDEAALCSAMAYDILLGRIRQRSFKQQLWITTTPRGRNWVYDRFVEQKAGPLVRASVFENPFVDEDYTDDLRGKYSGQFAQQELYAEFVQLEGLVYDQFLYERHVRQVPDELQLDLVVGGQDWGWTNPGVALVGGLKDDTFWLTTEAYETERDVDWWIIWWRQHPQVRAIYCDPSEPANIDRFRRAGLPAQPANNSVIPGITEVASLINQGRFVVSPECINTIREFGLYAWKQQRDGSIRRDEPEKQNDHAMDALRYMVMGTYRAPHRRTYAKLKGM